MRTALIALLLMLALNAANSQSFSLNTGVSLGLIIDEQGGITQAEGNYELQTQADLGKFKVSAVVLTILTQNLPTFYTGLQPKYQVWEDQVNRETKTTLDLTARYLYASGGEQLMGLGADYSVDKTIVSLNGDWNYKNKTAMLSLGIGYKFLE